MPFDVLCPNGHKLRVEAGHLGKRARCSNCGIVFVVPGGPGQAGVSPAAPMDIQPPEPMEERPPMTAAPYPGEPQYAVSPRPGAGLFGINLTLAQLMLLVGLVLVLAARGWDTLGARTAARATAQLQIAQNQFKDRWEEAEIRLTQQIEDLSTKPNPAAEDTKQLATLREDQLKKAQERQKEQVRLQRTDWRELAIVARDAAANNQVMAYWRELLFVIGSVLLTIGLVIVGVRGDAAQRWICLLMVAIITFSLYILGTAWGPK